MRHECLPAVHRAMGCGKKKKKDKASASVAVPLTPVRVPSQRPFGPSVASVTSVANDKGDNEKIHGVVHGSPEICITAEEIPGIPQLGDRLMKGLCH